MAAFGIEHAAGRVRGLAGRVGPAGRSGMPRLVALLGGTTNLADCLVALHYLIDRREQVRGPVIAEYEREFARTIGVRHAYSFSAGRVALYGLLRALNIGPGDEVLVQVPTHIVVPNAVRYTGARPVYVDCELTTYNMDLRDAERRITPRTRALVLQHTFGNPADIGAVLELTRRHGIELIEDCVHALGARYDGRLLGSFGRAAFFSTEETKTISSTMGGMLVTDDAELATRLRAFRAGCAWPSAALTTGYLLKLVLYHLLAEPHVHPYSRALYNGVGRRHPLPKATSEVEFVGARPDDYELRLSNAQANLALRQLRRLESNVAHRRRVAEAYRVHLSRYGFATPETPSRGQAAFVRYPIRVARKQPVLNAVRPHAILGTWFDSVLEEAASPTACGYEPGACPQAEAATRHLVNLPTHPRIEERDVDAIVSALVRAASPGA
ncbi:MAG: aminotransferase class I/II-fold pyridoxal phosphate-dependent enzyme [Chloroflexota bacterium]|nr:aminotransferase class I/II-fold pyridoxal phosphate-dependent enzyme [Chloroflexota bacterium]